LTLRGSGVQFPQRAPMNLNIIYQDNDVLVIDKPAGLITFPEGNVTEKTLIDYLIDQYPELKNAGEAPRYGIVHRLDKNTSGIMLVAKSTEALNFFQKQFINRTIQKKYLALVTGVIKDANGTIDTLIGRSKSDPRKQAAHALGYKGKTGLREAITEYKVTNRFADYTLLDVNIKTGRKHQIRCHMAYIHHPIAGDLLYGFTDSPKPAGLQRQFLHATYLRLMLPNGQTKEFQSDLPDDLAQIINTLEKI
jgi:23S rRNA pseudouridine1911/1915/1917 synthase